jgi:hypothetical protein
MLQRDNFWPFRAERDRGAPGPRKAPDQSIATTSPVVRAIGAMVRVRIRDHHARFARGG